MGELRSCSPKMFKKVRAESSAPPTGKTCAGAVVSSVVVVVAVSMAVVLAW
jgi:hypothetical protein